MKGRMGGNGGARNRGALSDKRRDLRDLVDGVRGLLGKDPLYGKPAKRVDFDHAIKFLSDGEWFK